MNITVFGAGLVGHAIVNDLAKDDEYFVTVYDIDKKKLEQFRDSPNVQAVHKNIAEDKDLSEILMDADLAISAVPGFMGFETLMKIIKTGTDVVDIAFFPEDPFALDEFAKEKGVTAVIDCGIAPGLCNIILGYQNSNLDTVYRYECFVGGLPKVRKMPFQYKAGFSPVDVLEEYIRPARFIEFGEEITKPALSEVELIDVPGVGTLEAFNTDGLRTLLRTMHIPFLKEKTLRYPGHADLMRVMRDHGFFSYEDVEVNGKSIKPIELTSKILFKNWAFDEGEEDLTFMRVIIDGEKNKKKLNFTYDLLDHYDQETKVSSMSRTTGYTCTAIARLILSGKFSHKGICPPEYIGRSPEDYHFVLNELAERKISLDETIKESK